jgi:hypothetical protein
MTRRFALLLAAGLTVAAGPAAAQTWAEPMTPATATRAIAGKTTMATPGAATGTPCPPISTGAASWTDPATIVATPSGMRTGQIAATAGAISAAASAPRRVATTASWPATVVTATAMAATVTATIRMATTADTAAMAIPPAIAAMVRLRLRPGRRRLLRRLWPVRIWSIQPAGGSRLSGVIRQPGRLVPGQLSLVRSSLRLLPRLQRPPDLLRIGRSLTAVRPITDRLKTGVRHRFAFSGRLRSP